MSEHWCICGLPVSDHQMECYVGDEPHSHWPALCCRDCPCESFKETHPGEFGIPLDQTELTPGVIKLLTNWASIHTVEDLVDASPTYLRGIRGIGPKRWLSLLRFQSKHTGKVTTP